MKMNKISSKFIKPHTPTPQNLRNYKISFLDQHVGLLNIAVVLFYESKPENNSRLQDSLSQILVQFYPLAGRYIKDDHSVDCNDEGAEFIEAEAPDKELVDLLEKTEIYQLLPDQYFQIGEAPSDPLLSIQTTHFSCGGVAIAISVSHRVFDVASLKTFITAWSNATKTVETLMITPSFELASLLPWKDESFSLDSNKCQSKAQKIAVKRVVFNKEALASLKSRVRVDDGKRVSGVRVACAVIAKALLAVDRKKHGRSRDFVIFQPINMRERTVTPPPMHACGNFSFGSFTRRLAADEAEEIGVQELVGVIGDGVRKSIANYAEILSPDRDGRDIISRVRIGFIKEVFKSETYVVSFTDWSKFGFYETDFGWGKPVWAGIGPMEPRGNNTVLMSGKGGDGIEAWVHLNQEEMAYFEQDEEIKLLIA